MSDQTVPITPTGAAMAKLRVKCIARYRLKGVAGHPEDLIQINNEQAGMSIVYGCYAVRVRLHHGREWLAHTDLPRGQELDAATVRRLFDILDPHFGWTPRGFPLPHQAGPIDPQLAAMYAPPIGGIPKE